MEMERRQAVNQDTSTEDWPFSYFKFDKDRDSPAQVRDSMQVVAALVVAASYGAMMDPPDAFDNWTRYRQLGFIYANTLAWSSSVTIMEMLTVSFPFQRELRLSYGSMGLAYGFVAAEQAELNDYVSYTLMLLCYVLPALIRWVPTRIKKCCILRS